jgi:hypothetical protein
MGFPSRSSAFSGRPDGASALAAVEAGQSLLALGGLLPLVVLQLLHPTGCRERGSGNVQDDSGNLLGDDVMDHVPGVRHLAQHALRQFRAQPPGLAVTVQRTGRPQRAAFPASKMFTLPDLQSLPPGPNALAVVNALAKHLQLLRGSAPSRAEAGGAGGGDRHLESRSAG